MITWNGIIFFVKQFEMAFIDDSKNAIILLLKVDGKLEKIRREYCDAIQASDELDVLNYKLKKGE